MKFQSVVEAPGGIIALSDEGDLYFCHWVKLEGQNIPYINWIKIPEVPATAATYPIYVEAAPQPAPVAFPQTNRKARRANDSRKN